VIHSPFLQFLPAALVDRVASRLTSPSARARVKSDRPVAVLRRSAYRQCKFHLEEKLEIVAPIAGIISQTSLTSRIAPAPTSHFCLLTARKQIPADAKNSCISEQTLSLGA
jgi:hypothetical protein